jgi:hypothetical protein
MPQQIDAWEEREYKPIHIFSLNKLPQGIA